MIIVRSYSPAGELRYERAAMDAVAPAGGPGTELKKLLGRFFIRARGDCACAGRAAEMDARGVEWCEQNIALIGDWLREAAARRGLPFVRPAALLLVRRAVKKARQAAPAACR